MQVVVMVEVVMGMDVVEGVRDNVTLHISLVGSMITVPIIVGKILANPMGLPILPLLMFHTPHFQAL